MENFTHKKKYGQHFLTDNNIAEKIASSLLWAGEKYRILAEIGPGAGKLTDHLIQNQNVELHLIEIDDELIENLDSKYGHKARIHHADFLKFKMEDYFNEQFGIIGNFPYNISTQIIFRILEYRHLIPEMLGMFQKEVAERIASKPGIKEYGILSVLVQAFYHVEILFKISNKVFSPPPKVESAVLRMTWKEEFTLDCDEKLFFNVVKTAFNQRTKTLRNSLHPFADRLIDVDIELLKKRPEQLGFQEFISLTKQIEQNN